MKTFVVGDIHGRRAQLAALLDALPRAADSDTLIFLGDLIDRGPDAPGVVTDVLALRRENPERVITLRGNHEQMMLDFINEDSRLWLSPVTGGEQTFQQYTTSPLRVDTDEDLERARRLIEESVPAEHLEFFRQMPLYHEDCFALYVHAGLDHGKHPRDTDAHQLLWTRDVEFYKKYRGKPCVFGHTPTSFLPLLGRLGRHGIYISHSAIGIDTGYNYNSPLTCLSLPGLHALPGFRRRPSRDPPDHILHS
jgi:serine/threonine protein phosphatase 1